MERALRNLIVATAPLEVVWPCSSLNAACALHRRIAREHRGVGKDADLVLLDAALEVRMTVAEGRIVYEA